MITLTAEEIIALHEKLIVRTGGSYGLRDRNLLESAVYSAASAFDGEEAYPSVEEKAARLMYSLTNNHAFVDGNKRIAEESRTHIGFKRYFCPCLRCPSSEYAYTPSLDAP